MRKETYSRQQVEYAFMRAFDICSDLCRRMHEQLISAAEDSRAGGDLVEAEHYESLATESKRCQHAIETVKRISTIDDI